MQRHYYFQKKHLLACYSIVFGICYNSLILVLEGRYSETIQKQILHNRVVELKAYWQTIVFCKKLKQNATWKWQFKGFLDGISNFKLILCAPIYFVFFIFSLHEQSLSHWNDPYGTGTSCASCWRRGRGQESVQEEVGQRKAQVKRIDILKSCIICQLPPTVTFLFDPSSNSDDFGHGSCVKIFAIKVKQKVKWTMSIFR